MSLKSQFITVHLCLGVQPLSFKHRSGGLCVKRVDVYTLKPLFLHLRVHVKMSVYVRMSLKCSHLLYAVMRAVIHPTSSVAEKASGLFTVQTQKKQGSQPCHAHLAAHGGCPRSCLT